jgi:hypothetical protein
MKSPAVSIAFAATYTYTLWVRRACAFKRALYPQLGGRCFASVPRSRLPTYRPARVLTTLGAEVPIHARRWVYAPNSAPAQLSAAREARDAPVSIYVGRQRLPSVQPFYPLNYSEPAASPSGAPSASM